MSKTITIELTMPKDLYKRYEKIGQRTGDGTVMVIAFALTQLIDVLEKQVKP